MASGYEYGLAAIQTVAPVSFGVYILMSLRRRVTTKAQVPATNLHTNPPSTRVSLPIYRYSRTCSKFSKPKHGRTFRSDSISSISEQLNHIDLVLYTCTHNEKYNIYMHYNETAHASLIQNYLEI